MNGLYIFIPWNSNLSNIMWTKNESAIDISNGVKYKTGTDSTPMLIINGATSEDSGKYSCMGTSLLRSFMSRPIHIGITPVRLKSPSAVNVGEPLSNHWDWPYLKPDTTSESETSDLDLYIVMIPEPHVETQDCTHVKGQEERHEYDLFSRIDFNSIKRYLHFWLLFCEGGSVDLENKDQLEILKDLYAFSKGPDAEPIPDDIRSDCSIYDSMICTGTKLTFTSDDVEKQTLWAYIQHGYLVQKNVHFLLDKAPVALIAKYFRTSGYLGSQEEWCICLPSIFTEKLIVKLDLGIIPHPTITDTNIHPLVSRILKIPEEILRWEYDQRLKFLKSIREESIEMFRGRAMIVGCVGAGKTTFLRRLQSKWTLEDLYTTESTVGLEVHHNLFQIEDNEDQKLLKEVPQGMSCDVERHIKKREKLISVTDFGGQCSYYACHQVYLTRRAFYILVIDMSKSLEEKVDSTRLDANGSIYEDWTYKEYFLYWMQSISTYCDDTTPVVLVATHKDKVSEEVQDGKTKCFYDELMECLPRDSELKRHLSQKRYFEIQLPPLEEIETKKIEKAIVEVAAQQTRWGERVPAKWAMFEISLSEMKTEKKMMSIEELKQNIRIELPEKDEDLRIMLSFFHEIGTILFFNEEGLNKMVIVDVQWFVDAFKNIITDPTQVKEASPTVGDWMLFNQTGQLGDQLLDDMWSNFNYKCFAEHKNSILQFMQRLGLIVIGREERNESLYRPPLCVKQEAEEKPRQIYHYVPCMNKESRSDTYDKILSNCTNKTSTLVFRFKTFLPHFFYYRLVVHCMTRWHALVHDDVPLVCKDAVFLKNEDEDHVLVLGVCKPSIQLQVVCREGNLDVNITLKIRQDIESMMKSLTATFHKQVEYDIGYFCQEKEFCADVEHFFISEHELLQLKKDTVCCSKHAKENHKIHRKELLKFWRKSASKEIGCMCFPKRKDVNKTPILPGSVQHTNNTLRNGRRKETFNLKKLERVLLDMMDTEDLLRNIIEIIETFSNFHDLSFKSVRLLLFL
ncbi:cyclic GMP-binding protein C-like isoform X1 [Saccostrea cucullata]|uniref:cyclic GMP-binding protein C-like isoform X1 n=1 Tax=Saccostrea cuccullata TaxID=36930 RepID=UPI002ED5543F